MKLLRSAMIVVAALIPLLVSASRTASRAAARQDAGPPDAAHGRYLVEEVAKCAECHTPRDAQGRLDKTRWMQGARLWIRPVHPVQNWAERVPPLGGFPGMTEAQGERVLEQGTGPNGEVLRPPMHIYHMTHEDARDIIAYLRTIPATTP